MDSPPLQHEHEHEPQRLSALYQYHNAPEVAPAHGLEYDDTVYPSSDKYPVIREAPSYDPSNYKGKHAFINDNRPPRIIFGMKVRTFLVVALVMALIIVGAAVGGAVGGKSMRENETQDGTQVSNLSNENSTAASSTSSATSTTSTFAAATPTYTPLSDCPASNDTGYTSSYAQLSSTTSTSTSTTAGLTFTKYCAFAGPLSQSGAARITEAYVYSFSDCIEVCAGYNYYNAGSNCTVAVYEPAGDRPANCWVGQLDGVLVSALKAENGTDVALLTQ
ncbi:hypothetical protein LTR36_002945 [Oleoguttula mirabilis]|uniref:Uncharacterized protein n=1 Tax=Oleoguttula mirabilis TaxID=1507867 RepID=A0AAV9JM88_9PEZI|nr:hypothetical protein LTR36_002945 [Oleoguttula mirabilis]